MNGQLFGLTMRCPACLGVNNVKAVGQTIEMKDDMPACLLPGFTCGSCSASVSIQNGTFHTS